MQPQDTHIPPQGFQPQQRGCENTHPAPVARPPEALQWAQGLWGRLLNNLDTQNMILKEKAWALCGTFPWSLGLLALRKGGSPKI